MARGIKARDCSRKGKKRALSWVEKLARKTKRYSQKKKKTQSVSVSFFIKILNYV
jgi:hypothetical protein